MVPPLRMSMSQTPWPALASAKFQRVSASAMRASACLRASMSSICETRWSGAPCLAVANDRTGKPRPDRRAVLVQVALLEMVGIDFARAHALHRFAADRDIVGMRDLEEGQRLQLGTRIAEHGGEGRVRLRRYGRRAPTTATPIAESSMARRKRCSLSAMRRRSRRVCSMISPPSNGSVTTIPTANWKPKAKPPFDGSRPGSAPPPPDRPAWRRPRRRRPPDRTAPGRRRRSSAEREPAGTETAPSWTAASASSVLAPTIAASRASRNGLDKSARRARETIIRTGNRTAKPSASPATQRQNDCISGHASMCRRGRRKQRGGKRRRGHAAQQRT